MMLDKIRELRLNKLDARSKAIELEKLIPWYF